MTRILGIDPGLASTGYGIIEGDGSRLRSVAFGVIRTPAGRPVGERLLMLYDELSSILKNHAVAGAGVESLFFAKNVTSALPVAQARGIVLLLLAREGVPAGEYPPQLIKQAVVGTGQARKEQIQEMVRLILGMKEIPRPDHAADALAAAITHYHNGQSDVS